VSETENPRTRRPHTGILDEVLRLSGGFSEVDRPWVLNALAGLEPHLARGVLGEQSLPF
jgi:hypothetical protein